MSLRRFFIAPASVPLSLRSCRCPCGTKFHGFMDVEGYMVPAVDVGCGVYRIDDVGARRRETLIATTPDPKAAGAALRLLSGDAAGLVRGLVRA